MINLDNYTEITKSPWNYVLYNLNDDYVLEVICGSVGMYSKYIHLTADEIIEYKTFGNQTLDRIAKIAQNETAPIQPKTKSAGVNYPFFSFTEEDLDINRNGFLSDRQKKQTEKTGLTILLIFASLSVIFSVLVLLMVKKGLFLSIFSFLPLNAIGLFFYWKARKAVQQGTVEKISGPIKIEYRSKIEYVVIGEQAFAFSFASQVFTVGKNYTLYFSSNKAIRSFEQLD